MTLYISGNTFSFGLKSKDINSFCKSFYENIKKKINPKGNIIVPTATYHLANKNVVYHKNLKSYVMGVFSEYVRKQKNSFRSAHPLWSFSGTGEYAKKILSNVPPSAFGADSVFERLLDYDAYFVCLGEPNNVIAMIHYIETIVGVPYRYNKEFYIKVKSKGKITKKFCTLLVLFNPDKIERDYNKKIIKILKRKKVFRILKFKKSKIYFCNYKYLIKILRSILIKNPKIWLKNEKIIQSKYHLDHYGKQSTKKKNFTMS